MSDCTKQSKRRQNKSEACRMIQQGQMLESQRERERERDMSVLTHRVFYHKIVFDSASTDVPDFLETQERHN